MASMAQPALRVAPLWLRPAAWLVVAALHATLALRGPWPSAVPRPALPPVEITLSLIHI